MRAPFAFSSACVPRLIDADRRDDVRREVGAEGDVVDAGPDVAAQFGDGGGGGHGRGPFRTDAVTRLHPTVVE